ncbi:MAG: tRNA (adenosine(37)-N6)-dimethylallyltransferase MiaA [Clostridiales bacterium]|nr:tRNA (adenosine(37)-N6)-dimethylallyltransferase MiaA [Clostridiales bacterium]
MKEAADKKLVILTGPTAVGKSALAVALARRINGEIISADSMQVYRHMDIGSAKIRPEEMGGVPHHLIDVLEPTEEFHVVLFQQMAKKAIDEVLNRGHIPVLTGGTGFYIQAVLYDIDFTDNDGDASFRARLEETAQTAEGKAALYERLRSVDPESCEVIHTNNVKRVIRAIEFYQKTGKKISRHNQEQQQKASPYRFAYFVLNDDRAKLYQQIDRRVDHMLEQGLVAEVEGLKAMGCTRDMVSMQGLGYKEILDYLSGERSLPEAVELIKRDTRHFAKRQLTWFRREKEVLWIDKQDFDYNSQQILDYMTEELDNRKILPEKEQRRG